MRRRGLPIEIETRPAHSLQQKLGIGVFTFEPGSDRVADPLSPAKIGNMDPLLLFRPQRNAASGCPGDRFYHFLSEAALSKQIRELDAVRKQDYFGEDVVEGS